MIAIGLVCSTIPPRVLAFATADGHVIAAGALCGLGYGTLMPAFQTISVHLAPAHKLGTGISTLVLLVDSGIGLGPIVLRSVAATMDFDKMYAGLAVVVVLAAFSTGSCMAASLLHNAIAWIFRTIWCAVTFHRRISDKKHR